MKNPPVRFDASSPISKSTWSHANKEILWCWKRDEGRKQRTIFFSGRLRRRSELEFELHDWSFFYHHRAEANAIHDLLEQLRHVSRGGLFTAPLCTRDAHDDYSILRLASRTVDQGAGAIIKHLQSRRPRKTTPQGRFPAPAQGPFRASLHAPITIYAGSGLSYECGLPTLADIHARFGVDDQAVGRCLFGADDPLPAALAAEPVVLLRRFCDFHLAAASAEPSFSHCRLGKMYRMGYVDRVLTDNVDNLFGKCGIPFERTRTVFPGRYSGSIGEDAKTLLVIGIAADRRQIIRQARRRGLKIVVVNPHMAVSPGAQNLSYLRRSDLWFRCTAREFMESIVEIY